MKDEIIKEIRKQLLDKSDEKAKTSGQRFFKEEINSYGVTAPIVNQIAKTALKQIKAKPKEEVFELCEQLWQTSYIEESLVACKLSYAYHKAFVPEDFEIFRRWITSYVNNWASCDTFCNHTMGKFIERYPSYIDELKGFTSSENRWLRRAAAVSLIVPARKGEFLSDIFEISDNLLMDEDDLVQKGYGWLLKVASKQHQKEVFEYILTKKASMPRTALRYAIEKMPKEMKIQAMGK
ncbi:DNA alkylation repair protein [Eudoraea sp.]|uniref:DNA alkylation repair protein n=1 Tax=Eudoraea sp. TaxID=1979955 RepID=UPI003C768499